MPLIGQTFRTAREKKKVTASQAAAATRMKVQLVEAMEREDFSKMAAPAYSKGFIKLYAEYLGVDPAPLLQEYMEVYAPRERTPLVTDKSAQQISLVKPAISMLVGQWKQWRPVLAQHRKNIFIGAAAILLVLFILTGVRRCAAPPETASDKEASVKSAGPVPELPVIGEPPEPYLETTSKKP